MNKEKAKNFIKELKKLEEKYELKVMPICEEEIDYNYEEEPYVSGYRSQLSLVDKNGDEMNFDDIYKLT